MPNRFSVPLSLTLVLWLPCMPAKAVDLLEAYQQARVSDPVYLAAEATYKSDKHVLVQASGLLLPTISGNAEMGRVEPEGSASYETRGYALSINQPIFNFSAFAGIAQARWEVKRATAEFSAAQQGLMLRVAERYLGALAAQNNVTLADAERSAISQQLQAAEGRLRAGLGTITEVHDARARFQLSEAKYLEASNAHQDALDALTEITGEFSDALKLLNTDIPTVRPQPENQQEWVDTGLNQNLTIKAKLAAYNSIRKRVHVERGAHLPTLEAEGKHEMIETTPAATTDSTGNSIGIKLKVPLFQGGIVASRTAQAKHLREAARQDLEASRRQTKRQTRSAYAGVISGIKRVDALKQAVVASESALKAKQTGFEAGINTNLDVLDAQRDLFETKRDYSQARYTYILDLLRLKQAAGQLGENDLKQINGWLQ